MSLDGAGAPWGAVDTAACAEELYRIAVDLYPVCRSITGQGVRDTLAYLRRIIPLEVQSIPSGTRVFDWTVPPEWNIADAYIRDPSGRKVVDFKQSNLHVLGYSTPVQARLPLSELAPHVFTLPERPDWIPYRTSYYQPRWGFCMAHRQWMELAAGEYEVRIEARLEPGRLDYGEYLVPGATPDEVLISTHICHPSLANDNLSGIAVCSVLARIVSQGTPRYSYRFLFIPGTIGSIAWLARNEAHTARIKHGLVATCLGDAGGFTYKRTRRGSAEIDRAVEHVLATSGAAHRVVDFSPYGYDERQYGSPGFDLPVGCLMRTPNGQYPEYHTSADDLGLIRPLHLAESLSMYLRVFSVLEGNRVFLNLNPKCEPQLGSRGLYDQIGGGEGGRECQMALLWVLNLSDGSHDLLEIARRAGIPFDRVHRAAEALRHAGLLAAS
jgi:aminopeptidase-like protein